VALQLDMGEEEKRGLVYIIVLLAWFVFYLFKTFFIVFEVLEKNLEASLYFSVLPNK
jgi:hypothetical protein